MNREYTQNNKDFSKLSRAEKLYVLSQICIQNSITPADTGFTGLIIRVCTSKLATSTEQAKKYSEDLISAYNADQWEGLAQSHMDEEIKTEETLTNTPRVIEQTKSILDEYKIASGEPVKRVEKKLAYEGEVAPASIAKSLMSMAQADQFNGVGRISIKEAQNELDNRALRGEDIIQSIKQFYPRADAEQRAGNLIIVYFDGKNAIQKTRKINRVIQPETPSLYPVKYTNNEPRYEKDAEYAKKDSYVGEAVEPVDEGDEIPEVE